MLFQLVAKVLSEGEKGTPTVSTCIVCYVLYVSACGVSLGMLRYRWGLDCLYVIARVFHVVAQVREGGPSPLHLCYGISGVTAGGQVVCRY